MTVQRTLPKGQTPARLNARGIDFSDYQKLDYQINRKGEDSVEVCQAVADHLDQVSVEKLQSGHKLSACQLSYKAAALYRISHYGLLQFDDEKEQLYRKELEVFSRAISLDKRFTAEKTEIPYKQGKLVGWLMKPVNCGDNVPVIIATGGITGFKEEVHYVVTHFLERGMAVFNLDGPGQGETFHHYGLEIEPESEQAHGVVIDYLLNRPDVGDKIALYGLCMGGLLVARTAAVYPDKIAGIVSMGGGYELASCLEAHMHFSEVFSYRGGVKVDEVYSFLQRFGMDTLSEKIACPLLVVHNRPDFLIPSSNVKRLCEEAVSADKQLVFFKGPEHNVHNENAEACALVADWFADRLLCSGKTAEISPAEEKQPELAAS